MFQKKRTNQKGQAVLIVLLSLSVVLIIVLYIMSRSVTDISLSNKEEDSMRAFSAAEAGVERALVIGTDIGTTSLGNANFSADVSDFGKGQAEVVYPMNLKSGEIATFWLSRPSEVGFTGTQAKICWGVPGTASSTAETPAVEISVFHKVAGVTQIARAPMDPNSGRTATNKFSLASSNSCTIDGQNFQFQTSINFTSLGTPQFMTVKLLYNNSVASKIGIDVSGSGSLLPSQGVIVSADGSFASANRSIEVYQLHPVAPSVFMNAIYSSNGITK